MEDYSSTSLAPCLTTVNGSAECEEPRTEMASALARPGVVWLATVVLPLTLTSLLTTCSNVLVIACVALHKKLRKPSNYYVVSLAVVDLLVGLLVMSCMCVYTVYGYWPLGDGVCTFWVCIDFSMCTVSMLHLDLISYDRYLALNKPIQYKSSNRARWILIQIPVVWIVGSLVWLIPILYFRLVEEPVPNDCYFLPGNKAYILAQSVIVYYCPMLVMFYFYVMCLHGMQLHYRKVVAMSGPNDLTVVHEAFVADNTISTVSGSVTNTTNTCSGTKNSTYRGSYAVNTSTTTTTTHGGATVGATTHTKRRTLTKAQKRRQDHIRSLRTLGAIIGVFLFCWLWFCLFWPISAYCDDCIPLRLYEYSYWAAYLNSTVNPLLYFVCNKDFRDAFRSIYRRVIK